MNEVTEKLLREKKYYEMRDEIAALPNHEGYVRVNEVFRIIDKYLGTKQIREIDKMEIDDDNFESIVEGEKIDC